MFAWPTSGERNGVVIQARFFDGDHADALRDVIQRSLPFLPDTPAQPLWSENDRRNLRWSRWWLRAMRCTGSGGLIQLEYKSRSKRSLNPASWLGEVRTKDLLQCLIAAVAVAQTQGRTCAPVRQRREHRSRFGKKRDRHSV